MTQPTEPAGPGQSGPSDQSGQSGQSGQPGSNPTPADWKSFYQQPESPLTPSSPPAKPFPVAKLVVAGVVALSVVICGCYSVWGRIFPSQPEPARTNAGAPLFDPATLPRVIPPSPTPAASPARRMTVVAPDKIGNRAKSTDADLTKNGDKYAADLKSIGASAVVGSFYGSHAKKDLVLILAIGGSLPASDLDILLGNVTTSSRPTEVTEVKPYAAVEADPLGGTVKGGEFTIRGVQVAVLGWRDDHSIGVVVFYYRTLTKAQAEFAAIRAAIEQQA